METQLQGVDSQYKREMPYAAAVIAMPQDDPKSARHRSVVLQSAIRFLAEAGRILWSNKDQAHVCIAKATALLQAESDVMEMGARPSGSNRLPLAPWQVTRVIGFIEGNLSKKIGVRDLAAIARLSPSHFARAFRATVGETPYAYLIRRRIEHAQGLILRADKPLVQIALECGFGDQAHIAKLFRRMVGVSPCAWRRAHGTTARDCDKFIPGMPPSSSVPDARKAQAVREASKPRQHCGPTISSGY